MPAFGRVERLRWHELRFSLSSKTGLFMLVKVVGVTTQVVVPPTYLLCCPRAHIIGIREFSFVVEIPFVLVE